MGKNRNKNNSPDGHADKVTRDRDPEKEQPAPAAVHPAPPKPVLDTVEKVEKAMVKEAYDLVGTKRSLIDLWRLVEKHKELVRFGSSQSA